jgi:hypothetical protein
MIKLTNGWVQWDNQIGTFRAELEGVLYGVFTGDIETVSDLKDRTGIELTIEQENDLLAEKEAN